LDVECEGWIDELTTIDLDVNGHILLQDHKKTSSKCKSVHLLAFPFNNRTILTSTVAPSLSSLVTAGATVCTLQSFRFGSAVGPLSQ
jgi:hypothetical protein